MTAPDLLKITTPQQWAEAQAVGEYLDPSLESEGFIHLSTPDQVLIPANERYAGQQGLILLLIERDRLTSPLVFEDSYRTGMAFPHVYGPLNLDAVVGQVDFPPDDDGTFTLPSFA